MTVDILGMTISTQINNEERILLFFNLNKIWKILMSPREQNKTKHVKSKRLNLISDFLLFNSVTLKK